MLHCDPAQRPSAPDLLSHDWLLHRLALPSVRLLQLDPPHAVKGALSATYRWVYKHGLIEIPAIGLIFTLLLKVGSLRLMNKHVVIFFL